MGSDVIKQHTWKRTSEALSKALSTIDCSLFTLLSLRFSTWTDAGYYKAIVTIDGAYDFEIIFLVHVQGQISCKYCNNLHSMLSCNFESIKGLGELHLQYFATDGGTTLLTHFFQRTTSTCQQGCLLWTKKPSGFTKKRLQMFAGRTFQLPSLYPDIFIPTLPLERYSCL